MFVVIDCPRCTGDNGDEVCPCLERFTPETIEKAIDSLRAEAAGEDDDAKAEDAGDDNSEDEDDQAAIEDAYTPLCHALKWLQVRDRPGIPLAGQSAVEQRNKLRAWAEEHKEIRIPHPNASLILHLLDHDMIEVATVPETGKIVLRAKGAKEEFTRFIAQLNRTYRHDEDTVQQLLCFAYGVSTWEFDPEQLRDYARGREATEIHTDGYDVLGYDCQLEGEPKEIESILCDALDCRG